MALTKIGIEKLSEAFGKDKTYKTNNMVAEPSQYP
jgi:hypothetical protein